MTRTEDKLLVFARRAIQGATKREAREHDELHGSYPHVLDDGGRQYFTRRSGSIAFDKNAAEAVERLVDEIYTEELRNHIARFEVVNTVFDELCRVKRGGMSLDHAVARIADKKRYLDARSLLIFALSGFDIARRGVVSTGSGVVLGHLTQECETGLPPLWLTVRIRVSPSRLV